MTHTHPCRLAIWAAAVVTAPALALAVPIAAGAAPAADSCGVLSSGASAAAQAAVQAACSQLGVWYTWGGGHGATPGATFGYYDGSDPASKDDGSRRGFDCSGLTRYAYYRATGRDILDGTASDQHSSPLAVQRFSAGQGAGPLLPGDLMFWGGGYVHHVAMYIGAGQMVEAYESGTRIRQTAVRTGGDYAGAIRLAASPGNPPPPPAGGGAVFQTWGTGVRTHNAPSTGAGVVDDFAGPTQVGVICQEHAQKVTAEGYTNDAWSKLSDGSWITNIYLKGPAWLAGVADCGGTPPPSGGITESTWGSDVRTHSAASTDAGVVDLFPGPTRVGVVCQEHAQKVSAEGYTNDAWSKLSDGSWITNIYLKGDAWLAGVPGC
ncbi:C40 family peptidase [Streptantibioticus silvisoli]|uniref:NlpC/P60 family protein n=1 Tax=Streptantibioticus silvisoli TaxID=2705255 RepID=A0ABT6W2F3_9ACTN|nr:NlpC/P60 family protein [Streptantibioticus silvisoli]MDI5964474.1 NlpC/P60 family protein [Streptantibioticus silvisoli]